MTDSTNAESETSKFIEDFVQKHWEQQQSACYLSILGYRLKNDLPDSQNVIADGLHEYLKQNEIVRVIQHPEIVQKVGAVPLSVQPDERIEDMFSKKAGSSSDQKWRSYDKAFWDAFINPIKKGEVRSVHLHGTGIEVSDRPESETKNDCYKITSENLTKAPDSATISERVTATHQAIEVWLEKNRLQPDAFRPPQRRSSDRLEDFFNVFTGFSKEDLSRITIPLVILFKLSSKK